MVVRKVNGKLPDANSNVNVGTVTSINEITPNSLGELTLPINIPNGKFITVEELMLPTMLDSGNYMVAISDGTILPYENQCMVNVAIFDTGTPNYKGKVLTVTNVGDGDGNNGKFEASVKIQSIDIDENLVMGDPDWIPYKPEVHDNLDSTDADIALSANMGKVLYDMNNFIMDELEEHIQQGASAGTLGHVRIDNDTIKASANTYVISVSTASETQKGAVKVDGETITIDENGVIKAVGGGSGESVPDASLTVKGKVQLTNDTDEENPSQSLALTQFGGKMLNTAIRGVADSLDQHESTIAKDGALGWIGHVKPDGVTISADENGTISVIGGDATTLSDDYMLNDSNVASSTKATTNLANDFVDNINDLNAEDARLQSVINIVSGQLTTHESVKASETVLGHVMVDGITILADETGMLTSVAERGEQGEDGKDGSKWYIGAGDPTGVAVGVEGDFYLDRNDGQVYGHNGTSWVEAPANLKGSKWSVGQTVPAVGYPATENDYFLHMPSCDVYVYTNNAWVKTEYNIKGTDGADGDKGDQGDPLQIVDNLTSTDTDKALSANQGKVLKDALDAHSVKNASTTEFGHVKIDGQSVKMNENDQLFVDVGELPIPVQVVNEFIPSSSPTTYPPGHTITLLNSDAPGFSDLVSLFNIDFNVELSSLNVRFIVETIKSSNNITHQTAKAVTASRGTVLATAYRFSQSSMYGFSSWYTHTQTLVGRGVPGDGGRGEGINGNMYVDVLTGKVYAKSGSDKTVGYSDWKNVSLNVVNNTFSPVIDDVENVYSAYTTNEMILSHASTKATNSVLGHVKVDGTTITVDDGVISATQLDIIDNFITDDATKVLSAKRGKLLYDHIIGVDVDFASHKTSKASDLALGHVRVDGDTIQINNDGEISTVPIRINNQYVKGTLASNATELTLDVSAINMTDVTLEVYDSGLLLMDDEYTLDYVEEDDELVFEWAGKPYPTTIMVKISKIAIAYN